MSARTPSPADIEDAVYGLIYELIVWNAPDHEHTRIQVRKVVEQAMADAFDEYNLHGGDPALGLYPGNEDAA